MRKTRLGKDFEKFDENATKLKIPKSGNGTRNLLLQNPEHEVE